VAEENGFRETRRDMDRAIRRLNALEFVILGGAVVVALAGGAAVAFVISAGTEWSFRFLWVVSSLLLLIVPGVAVFGRERRTEARKKRSSQDRPSDGA
jgi:protein-S-isoprenylcysteine O-methyltransferase Ste14